MKLNPVVTFGNCWQYLMTEKGLDENEDCRLHDMYWYCDLCRENLTDGPWNEEQDI